MKTYWFYQLMRFFVWNFPSFENNKIWKSDIIALNEKEDDWYDKAICM